MKIQLKRSNVLDGGVAKAPTAEQMEYGELALNYSATDPSIFIKNSSNTVIKIAGEGAITDEWKSSNNFLFPTNLNSSVLIGASAPDTPTIRLNVDGSAEFAGNVSGGGGWQSSPTEGGYRLHSSFGQLALSTTETTDAGNFIQCQNTDGRMFQVAQDGSASFAGNVGIGTLPTSPNITLNATAGSATFAGNVVIGDLDTSSTSGKGARIRYTPSGSNANFGNFLAQCDGASPNPGLVPAVYAYNGTSQVAAINFDGSASFAGSIITGDGSPTNGANTSAAIYPTGQIGLSRATDGNCLTIYKTTETKAKVLIQNTGAIETVGTVKIGPAGRELGSTESSSIQLNAGGSASFAGNVGIGTTSSVSLLHLKNDATSGTDVPYFRCEGNASNLQIKCDDLSNTNSGWNFTTGSSESMRFVQGADERLRIDSSGDVLIGGTLPSSPNISLNANGTSNFSNTLSLETAGASQVTYRTTSDAGGTLCTWNSDVGGTKAEKIRFGCNGSATFAGKVTNSSGGYEFPDGTTQTTAAVTSGAPGNGALTIKTAGQGSSASGTFTANQSGASTLTLPVIRYQDVSGTPSIPAAANNGQINVSVGTGLSASGSNATANQSGNTTRTLSLDTTYTDGRYVKETGATMTGNLDVPSLNTGPLAGLRNVIINGAVTINQRNKTYAAVGNNAYWADRWKKVSGGMTQIIESGNFVPSTQYTLSGSGVTTQQVTSPASGNWTIPTVPATATNIQMEIGPVATPFEQRPRGLEWVLCQRYFELINAHCVWPVYAQGAPGPLGAGFADFWKVTKRVRPTAQIQDVTYVNSQNAGLQTIDGDCVLVTCELLNVESYSQKKIEIVISGDAEL